MRIPNRGLFPPVLTYFSGGLFICLFVASPTKDGRHSPRAAVPKRQGKSLGWPGKGIELAAASGTPRPRKGSPML